MNEVVELPTSDHLNPEQAIAEAAKVPWDRVMVIGYDADNNFIDVHSHINCSEALWLLEVAKIRALSGVIEMIISE